MKRGLFYLLAGLAAFLLFLAITLPASVVFGWLAPQGLSATGIEGTIWRGEARVIAAEGIALQSSRWRLSPAGLLRGELAYTLETGIDGSPIRGVVGLTPGGTLRLRELRGSIPLASLAAILPTGFFVGVAEIEIAEASLVQGWPVAIHGRVWVEELKLLISQPPAALGSFQLTFDDQTEFPLAGRLSDLGGPVELSGSLLLKENRCYERTWTVTPRAAASRELGQIVARMQSIASDSACL